MNALLDHRHDTALDRIKSGPFMQTHFGRAFPLVHPEPEDVHWDDVAYHLAHANRFAGAAGTYSVAQHSIIVAQLLPPELALHGLLHDAHEFAIGDITTPTKQALIAHGMNGAALRRLKHDLDRAIYTRAGVAWPFPPVVEREIKRADLCAMATERRDLMTTISDVTTEEWLHGCENVPPMSGRIVAWPADMARRAFLDWLGSLLN